MKTVIPVLICLMSLSFLNAQESEVLETEEKESLQVPFSLVEEVPIFPGCEEKDITESRKCFQEMMQQHVAKNFRYPEIAHKKNLQGRVSTMFIIEKDGSISSIKTHGSHPILEEEARRILSLLPQMKPGKQRGEAVRVPFSIPISFKLQ